MCLKKHKPKGGHHTGKGRWPCHQTGNTSHTYSQKNLLQERKAWNACSIMYKIIGGLLPWCHSNYSTEIMAGMKQIVLKYFQITWSDLCKIINTCMCVMQYASVQAHATSHQTKNKENKKKRRKKTSKTSCCCTINCSLFFSFFATEKGFPHRVIPFEPKISSIFCEHIPPTWILFSGPPTRSYYNCWHHTGSCQNAGAKATCLLCESIPCQGYFQQ